MDKKLDRKLAAILYADVAGYSRLTGDDEEGTHRQLSACLDLITETITKHDGKVVHYAGDAMLADFATVSNGLACAVEIQKRLQERNADLPEDRKVEFRIGLNLGEVIVDRGDIYGDGVNVAARLESLADPGGICISESVRTAIGKKLDLAYEFMGEQKVKNIDEPVRAYRVSLSSKKVSQTTSPEKPALALADKPSIAVLPFTNMSGDPEQEYFADGLTENLITTLSKISGLFVIARNSTFTYKGKPVKVQQVAQELGVRYVLEGSVQRSANRVRINAQLIDALNGSHIWADRYDRDATDVFALQDEIALHLLTELQVKLTEGEQARVYTRSVSETDLPLIEMQMKALALFRNFTKPNNAEARTLLERIIEMGGETADRLLWLGWTHWMDARVGWSGSPEQSLTTAHQLAEKAVALDSTDTRVKSLLANVALLNGDYDHAISLGEEAVASAPNNADEHYVLGFILNYSGRPAEAVDVLRKAMRLSPYYPQALYQIGISQCLLRRYDEAIDTFRQCAARNPESRGSHVWLAIIYTEVGRDADARAAAEQAIRLDRQLSIAAWANTEPFRDADVSRRMLDAMRKAGLPE